MSIKKVKGLESNFSIIPNDTINDSLSWGAKGLLAYLCSKPDDWSVSVAQLCNHSKLSSKPTGRDGTYTIINELMCKGYMKRVQCRATGKFQNTEYIVSATPITDLPDTDKADTANPTLQSKDINKEQLVTKNSIINSAFDSFWSNMFLSKKAKPNALKAFKKILTTSKPKIDDPMHFANFLVSDTETRFNNKQFGFDKMHPATYLNQNRWEDDYTIDQPRHQEKANIASDSTDWINLQDETF